MLRPSPHPPPRTQPSPPRMPPYGPVHTIQASLDGLLSGFGWDINHVPYLVIVVGDYRIELTVDPDADLARQRSKLVKFVEDIRCMHQAATEHRP